MFSFAAVSNIFSKHYIPAGAWQSQWVRFMAPFEVSRKAFRWELPVEKQGGHARHQQDGSNCNANHASLKLGQFVISYVSRNSDFLVIPLVWVRTAPRGALQWHGGNRVGSKLSFLHISSFRISPVPLDQRADKRLREGAVPDVSP